jgi:hypothetical protein
MDTALTVSLSLIFGFTAGLIIWQRIVRWIYGLYLVVKEKRSLWLLPMAGILHSAPWLVVAAVSTSIYIFSKPQYEAARWFVFAMCMAPLFAISFVVRFLRRRKQQVVERAQP